MVQFGVQGIGWNQTDGQVLSLEKLVPEPDQTKL